MRSYHVGTRRGASQEGARALRHQLVTTVLQRMKEGIVCQAPDGRILEMNSAAERLLGISRRAARGLAPADLGVRFRDPAGREIAPASHPARLALARGRPEYGRHLTIERDGRLLHLSLDVIPIVISSSRRVVSVYRDITHLVAGAEELRSARTHLSRLLDSAPVGIGLCDGDARLRGSNPVLSRILGRSVADIDGCCLSEWLVEGDPEAFRSTLREHADGRRSGHLHASISRPDGEIRELRISAAPLGDAGSPPFALFVEDETEGRRGRRIEKMLARAADVFSTSIANLPERMETLAEIVLPAVADACLVDIVEGAGLRRVYTAHGDPASREKLDRLDGFPLGAAEHRVPRVLVPGRTLRGNAPIEAHLDGSPVASEVTEALRQLDFSSYVTLPMHARGDLVGAITFLRAGTRASFSHADLGLLRAISTRVAMAIDNARLYSRMEKALESRERLLAIVSHDLRSPIGTAVEALNFLQIKEKEGEIPLVTRNLAIADRSLRRALGLIDDLLDLRRRDHGTLAIEPTTIGLGEFIADVVAANDLLASREGITIRSRVRCDDNCALFADHDRMHQVFANLISNAIKNTPRDSALRLIAIARRDTVLIAVSDHGAGMTEEQIEHMLEWGWQAKEEDRRGFGIGLAVVKMIVEAHGGRVAARRRPAGGLCVQVILPRESLALDRAMEGTGRTISLGEAVGLQRVE